MPQWTLPTETCAVCDHDADWHVFAFDTETEKDLFICMVCVDHEVPYGQHDYIPPRYFVLEEPE